MRITEGPLVDICMAVNRVIMDADGHTGYCILAAAATRDILQAKGYQADVLRVEAAVFFDDRNRIGTILGSRGDGTRRPASNKDMWKGHLVAVADGKWLLDPTLDQTRLAPPMVVELPDGWLNSWKAIFIPITDGQVRYAIFPQQVGYKSAPDFRPSRRRWVVEEVLDQLG